MSLVNYLGQTDTIKNLNQQATAQSAQLLLGVNGTARAASIAAMFKVQPRQMLVITDTQAHAEQLYSDLTSLVGDAVYHFPAEESVATEMAISSPELRRQRVQTLIALLANQPMLVVTNLTGIEQLLPAPMTLREAQLKVHVGQNYNLNQIKNTLMMMGYTPVKLVQTPGEFCTTWVNYGYLPINFRRSNSAGFL